jgi:hypothetical protein
MVGPHPSSAASWRRPSLVLGACAVAVSACSFRAYSPPAGWSPNEHVAPLAEGKMAVRGSLDGGGGLFGPDLVGGTLGFRRGLTPTVELQVDGAWVHIDSEPRSDVARGIGSLRVGLKGLFDRRFRHASWFAALGGGAHAAGGFVSPELGAQLGYENPWVTPWVRLSAFLSQPIAARAVDLAPADAEQPDLDTPLVTAGFRVGAGLSMAWSDFPLRFHLGVHFVQLLRVDGENDTLSHASLGFEGVF